MAKFSLLTSILLLVFFAKGQFINLEKDWYTHENFFYSNEIKENKIRSISIYKQEKKMEKPLI